MRDSVKRSTFFRHWNQRETPMSTGKPLASLKLVLGVLLSFWLLLGTVAYSFYPHLTGHRVLDALLVSAIVTSLLATLAEPIVGLLYGAVRHLSGRTTPTVEGETEPALPEKSSLGS
jgi:hypothetical protein